MGNPLQFSVGQAGDNFDLICLFFDTFEDMKTELFLVKRKSQVFENPFLKSVKSSVFLQDLFGKKHSFFSIFQKF